MRTTHATDPALGHERLPQRTERKGRARRNRAIGALSACALSIPGLLLGALPALAAPACTFTPYRPDYAYTNSSGVKVLKYRLKVYCAQERYVNFEQLIMEEDGGFLNEDDHLATEYAENHHYAAGETYTYVSHWTLPDTETGQEEMYQQVKFQEGSGGVWSPWYGWYLSPVLAISN